MKNLKTEVKGFLRTQGRDFVNGDGEKILLRSLISIMLIVLWSVVVFVRKRRIQKHLLHFTGIFFS